MLIMFPGHFPIVYLLVVNSQAVCSKFCPLAMYTISWCVLIIKLPDVGNAELYGSDADVMNPQFDLSNRAIVAH